MKFAALASPPFQVEFSFTGWRDSGPHGLIRMCNWALRFRSEFRPFLLRLKSLVANAESGQLVVQGAAWNAKPLSGPLNGAGFLGKHSSDMRLLHLAQGLVSSH